MKVRVRQEGERFYILPDTQEEDQGFDMSIVDTFVQGQSNFSAALDTDDHSHYFAVFLSEEATNTIWKLTDERGITDDEAIEYIILSWVKGVEYMRQAEQEAMRGG